MTDLTTRVLAYIRKHELLRPGDRVGVAVSGGADSVALLRSLLQLRSELGTVLSVVHFNHQLRGADADADEAFVRELAAQHRLECHVGSGDARAFARAKKMSVETAARELRYTYFRSLMSSRDTRLDKIATAHTLDDQAETVLMRIIRGTGTAGLAGIYPVLMCGEPQTSIGVHPERSEGPVHWADASEKPGAPDAERSCIIRPFLEIRRAEIEASLRELDQPWRDDASNLDVKHTRNRVRHQLLPLLERDFNPAVRERLADMAEIARADEDYWQQQVRREVRRLTAAAGSGDSFRVYPSFCPEKALALHLDLLAELPLGMKRRVVRAAADSVGLALELTEVERVLALGTGTASFPVHLHDEWAATIWKSHITRGLTDPSGLHGNRRSGHILLLYRIYARQPAPGSYEYRLNIPGKIGLPETGTLFRARLVPISDDAERVKQRETPGCQSEPSYNQGQLLNPLLLTSELLVRNWRPGDRFWPAHTSSPKKVKELLQRKHATATARETWPVVVGGDEIVWMRGFPVPEKYRPPKGAKTALLIEEVTMENE